MQRLSRFTIAALICVGIWVLWLVVELYGAYFGSGVWRITAEQLILVAAMALSIPVLLVCAGVFLYRKSQGLPVFTVPVPLAVKVVQHVTAAAPVDPLDPNYQLKNPPAGAQVQQVSGRRAIILADGAVIGEMLGGRARRFGSLDEFRAFIGASA